MCVYTFVCICVRATFKVYFVYSIYGCVSHAQQFVFFFFAVHQKKKKRKKKSIVEYQYIHDMRSGV